jgi:hypothetical protein
MSSATRSRHASWRADGDALDELLERSEDADEPVSAALELEERAAEAFGALDPEREDPALAMAEAVVLYPARRRDEAGAPRADVLRLAARSELRGRPPAHVDSWLCEPRVQV